ncbi:hypothetical protein SAMN04515674_108135 [Pseudarcicella hirudinis]|uniref:Uncharacterized protein n=2 Tax=Pseudarcicella hirudinis TaxID=1079859 RepID=A0A1I5V007_9BACT|nr:hypothetical protein SAMN04515674_108135 [Pseudarcicella hirudinis]
MSIILAGFIFSCKKSSTDVTPTPDPTPNLTLNDTFEKSFQGWVGGFSDYPVGSEAFYELKFSQEYLPQPLDTTQKAIRISGNNHSDDLFMFLKKKLTGFKANKSYSGAFEVSFASSAAQNMAGAGGAPGEDVSFGIGITSIEPLKVIDSVSHSYKMNIKKINQSKSGDDMKVIGNVANGTNLSKFTIIKRTGEFTGKTDANGNFWLIVGTDSGFESTTTLYYTGIKVLFTEVK